MKRLAVCLAVLLASAGSRAEAPDGGAPHDDSDERLRQDLAFICDSEALSGAKDLKDPEARARRLGELIAAHHPGPRAVELWEALSAIHPYDKAPILFAAAMEAGLGRCALAESSERELEASLERECKQASSKKACDALGSIRANWRKLMDEAKAQRPSIPEAPRKPSSGQAGGTKASNKGPPAR